MTMSLEDAKELYELYKLYSLTNLKSIRDKILLYCLDLNFTESDLETLNTILLYDEDMLRKWILYTGYIFEYNLEEYRYITHEEKLSIELLSINLDENGLVIDTIEDEWERFLIYYDKFMEKK